MITQEDDQCEHTYLGDGLYAEWDGYSLRLYTQQGNQVFLEPDIWAKLKSWMDQ